MSSRSSPQSQVQTFSFSRESEGELRKSYFDCRRYGKRKRYALFLRCDLNRDKAGFYKFQLTNVIIYKHARAKGVDSKPLNSFHLTMGVMEDESASIIPSV